MSDHLFQLELPQLVTVAGKALLDVDGLQLLDDGFQTCQALKILQEEFDANSDPTCSWPQNVVDIFTHGLPMDYRTYGEVYERETHIALQTLRHDESQNRFRPSSIWQKLNVVERYAKKLPGREMAKVSAAMIEVFGKGKKPTISRWIRAHNSLHPEVVTWLETCKSLPDSYVFDNQFLLGPGPQKLAAPDAVIALTLLKKMREDGKAMNPDGFKSQICSPLLIKASWVKTMKSQFGALCTESPVLRLHLICFQDQQP